MDTFEYKAERIVGLNCPAKLLVSINNIKICFMESKKSLENILKYATDFDESRLENKKIKNKIKEAVLQQGGN